MKNRQEMQSKPSLPLNLLPIEVLTNLLSYCALREVNAILRIDKRLYLIINDTIWTYELQDKNNYYVPKPKLATFKTMSSEMFELRQHIKSEEFKFKIERMKLRVFGDPNSILDQDQVRHSVLACACGFICGACLPGLWSSQFHCLASSLLGTLIGLGCMAQYCSDSEKNIAAETHQSRFSRLKPLYEEIDSNLACLRYAKFFKPQPKVMTEENIRLTEYKQK